MLPRAFFTSTGQDTPSRLGIATKMCDAAATKNSHYLRIVPVLLDQRFQVRLAYLFSPPPVALELIDLAY